MTAEAAALVRSWPVGRYTCTMTVPRVQAGTVSCVAMEWSPDVPTRLTRAELRQYREGRDAAIAELGLAALVVEL